MLVAKVSVLVVPHNKQTVVSIMSSYTENHYPDTNAVLDFHELHFFCCESSSFGKDDVKGGKVTFFRKHVPKPSGWYCHSGSPNYPLPQFC